MSLLSVCDALMIVHAHRYEDGTVVAYTNSDCIAELHTGVLVLKIKKASLTVSFDTVPPTPVSSAMRIGVCALAAHAGSDCLAEPHRGVHGVEDEKEILTETCLTSLCPTCLSHGTKLSVNT